MGNKNRAIGVIGQGFVGGTLTTVFAENGIDVYPFDKAGKYAEGSKPCVIAEDLHEGMVTRYPNSIEELVLHCERRKDFSKIYFVCVPTPMNMDDGSCDTSIVENVLDELAKCDGERIAVVKSTVPPSSCEKWNKKYSSKGLHIVHNPEFLTEKNALDDFRHQNRILLGGPRPHINFVKNIYQTVFPRVPIIKTNSTTTEMVKYFTNIHLAARVVLSCELAEICESLDKENFSCDYDKVVSYAADYDKRLGGTHMSVPGNNSQKGIFGHCFPKDLNACIAFAKKFNVKPTVMEAVNKRNLDMIKPEDRDWEQMIGRAVTKKE